MTQNLDNAITRMFVADWRMARHSLGWTQRLSDAQAQALLDMDDVSVSGTTATSWYVTGYTNVSEP